MTQTNFEKFMELMNKKGLVRNIQVAKQFVPNVAIGEAQKAIDEMCVGQTITKELLRDPELKAAYDYAANELMFNKIVENIDLEKKENFEFTAAEAFAKTIAEAVLGDILKGFKSSK